MEKTCLIIIIFLVFSLFAQISPEIGSSQEQKLERFFDQIMLTFPDEVKARIDSASTQSAQKKGSETAKSGALFEDFSTQRRDAQLNELPEEIRNKVEKAIFEMEERRNERTLQFKDYKENRKIDD